MSPRSLVLTTLLWLPRVAFALDAGFSVEEVLPDLDVPVFFDFAPDGRIFYSEYETGQVRVVSAELEVSADPVATFDDVEVYFERGFLGLELDPDFADNHHLYVYYSSTDGTHKLVRITEADGVATDITYLRDDLPLLGPGMHNGGPIVFGPDRTLYLSVGEMTCSDDAQDPEAEVGKILRYERDGSIPADNPFGSDNPAWAYGLRNTFGLAFNPLDGQLYGSENGPTVDDEVNLMEAGANYGWPLWTGAPGQDGFEDALITWTPNICPTGIAVYCGSSYPEEYLGDLFLGNCDGGRVRRLELSGDGSRILEEDPTWYAQPQEGLSYEEGYYGVLDVVNGPDGNIWFSTALGIYRFVYAAAPAGPADLDCDLFDGEYPVLDDDDTIGDDDDVATDDDSAAVQYKKCVCTMDASVDHAGLAAAAAALLLLACRRFSGSSGSKWDSCGREK